MICAGTNKTFGCRVTSTYMSLYQEDLMRFDFEVDQEDEHMCSFPFEIDVN